MPFEQNISFRESSDDAVCDAVDYDDMETDTPCHAKQSSFYDMSRIPNEYINFKTYHSTQSPNNSNLIYRSESSVCYKLNGCKRSHHTHTNVKIIYISK